MSSKLSRTHNKHRTSRTDTITVDLQREKAYKWPIEQLKRKFRGSKKSLMPIGLMPMLASVRNEAFNDAGWQFEIKWDGYRVLAYNEDSGAELLSRNNLSFNAKFPLIVEALKAWPVRAVLDGEAVILSKNGKADFGALQNYQNTAGDDLHYFVFDLLWVEGIDLRSEPLHVRRKVLKEILPGTGIIRYSESIDECGIDFLASAKNAGVEGIIAKRKDSVYSVGVRTPDWYKIKLECRHEALICGYTKQKGSDRLFSSLVLGIPTASGLRYVGQVGTGFPSRAQRELFKKMNPLFTADCPFKKTPSTGAPTLWIKPELVCEVKYTALTADGLMRHASFQGLREDKDVSSINLDETCAFPSRADEGSSESQPAVDIQKEETKKGDKNLAHLQVTNLDKIYWPKEEITKGEMLHYYQEMAPYILPYLLDRPQSLNRFPDGIDGESFYQKDMKGNVPPWIKTYQRVSESDGKPRKYLVCDGEASLLYMANLGCIELNPWHSRTFSPLRPDWCVLDLDPGRTSFNKVIETARVIRAILDSLQIPSFPKTSGSTGLHIYIPLGGQYSYEQSRHLAELIVTLTHQELPAITSLERKPERRRDKIYLDYLQNREIQTICAPYSLRPKAGATASAPLHWEEVKNGLKLSPFTIHSLPERVKSEGDLFKGVLGTGIDLDLILQSPFINNPS